MLNNNGLSIEVEVLQKVFQTMCHMNYLLLFSAFCLTNSHELILKQVK